MKSRFIQTKKIQLFISLFLSAFTCFVFYIVNKESFFSSDDLYYMTNLSTGQKLESVFEIIPSQIWHYFNWGGRAVAHSLLQFTLYMGEMYANITNVICTGLLVFLIVWISNYKVKWTYLLAISFLIFLNPNWIQTLFWESGFANYIYTIIFVLIFLYQFIRLAEYPERKQPIGITFWIIPLGLFAGWSNENIGPTISLCVLGIILFLRYKKKAPPLWTYLGNIFCAIGSVLLIVSPGNKIRSEIAYADVQYGIVIKVLLRFYHIAVAIFEYLFPALLLLFFVLSIYLFVLKMRVTITDVVFLSMIMLSIGIMILSPHYPDRAVFGTLVFIIITILHLLGLIISKYQSYYLPYIWIALILWIGMIFILIEYILNLHGSIPIA